MTNEKYASLLPHSLKYFVVSILSRSAHIYWIYASDARITQPATSLGGVESLIEQRVHSDPGADPRLIRISAGVEDLEVRSFCNVTILTMVDASTRRI